MLCHLQKELLTVQAARGAIIQAPTLIGCEFLKSERPEALSSYLSWLRGEDLNL